MQIEIVAPSPGISALSSYLFSADDEITLTGTNLGTTGTVKFGNLVATQIISWSSTQIKCIVPEGVANGVLTVTTSAGTSNGISYSIESSTGDPVVVQLIPDLSMNQNETKTIAFLSNVFSDPNNDALSYSVSINGSNIYYDVNKLGTGELVLMTTSEFISDALVTVNATDADNVTISDEFKVFAPVVPPALNWPAESEFFNDGITPNSGYDSQIFAFAVQVTPGTNAIATGYPKLHVLKNNIEISGSPFTMTKNLTFSDAGITISNEYFGYETTFTVGSNYSYFVELKDNEGNNATGTPTLKHFGPAVNEIPVPIADFKSDKQTILVGETVSFSDLSSNFPTTWHWDFGDGSASTELNPVHTYHESGIYTVSLTVTNEYGQDLEVKTNYIEVLDNSVAQGGTLGNTEYIN